MQLEKYIMMKYISEDNMWKDLMEQQLLDTPELTPTECFWKIFAKGNTLFWKNMQETMQKISESNYDKIVLYLDKIVFPGTLESMIKKLNSAKPRNCDLKFVAFVPTPGEMYSFEGKKYPFSLSLLFDCIVRVIHRTGHATL